MVARSWPGGPLRHRSERRESTSWTPYGKGGYAGPYVCDVCQRPVDGVYRVISQSSWACGPCRDAISPKLEQPKALKAYRESCRGGEMRYFSVKYEIWVKPLFRKSRPKVKTMVWASRSYEDMLRELRGHFAGKRWQLWGWKDITNGR